MDYRSACIMIWLFDHLSGVLFVNCRESLKMFISLSSFPFFKRHLVHQDTFLYIYNWPLLLCNLLNTFKKQMCHCGLEMPLLFETCDISKVDFLLTGCF